MISAQGLTKYYGDKCAIEDLDFKIAEGEIVGILGLNGAGKTTALRILACLLLPSRGSVRINNLDVVAHPHEVRKLVGFLPEAPPLYDDMTVESFLLFAGQLRGLSRDRTRARLEQTLDATHIADVRRDPIGSLSHSYRQRVGIAQAVIHDPPVLILDEPIQGLDPVQIVEMRQLVLGLKGKHTILLSSHILSEIHQTCDRILMVQQGHIVAVGSERELTAQFRGARRLRIGVRGDAQAVTDMVRGLPNVDHCQLLPGNNHEGVVQLDITTAEDIREQLSRALIERGFGLLEMRPAEAELESVFIRLSQQGSRPVGQPKEEAR